MKRAAAIFVFAGVVGCGGAKAEPKNGESPAPAAPAGASLAESPTIELVFVSEPWVASHARDTDAHEKTVQLVTQMMDRLRASGAPIGEALDAAIAATLSADAARDSGRPKPFGTTLDGIEQGGPLEVLEGARAAKPGEVFKSTRRARGSSTDPPGIFVGRRSFVSTR